MSSEWGCPGEVRESRPDRLRRRLSGDIDNIVLMAMRKEASRRYASVEQFADDIGRHIAGLPVRARPDTLAYRIDRFVRRHRAGVAAAALIVVTLIAGIVATTWQARIARTQRDEAARQKQIAVAERDVADRRFEQVRELAHTFLYEFHDRIVELEGSIPARQLLVDTAVTYLEGLRNEVGDDEGLIDELANGYSRLGDIRGGIRNPNVANTAAAIEHYLDSLELRRALLARAGSLDDAELRGAVARSLIRIGDLQMRTSRVGAAAASFAEAAAIYEQLAQGAPGDLAARRRVAVALNVVAASLSRMGDLDAALEQYQRSLTLRESIAALQPEVSGRQRDLSTVHTHLGSTRVKTGELERALEHFRAAVEIRSRLYETDPTSARARRDLAIARGFVGQTLLKLDRPQDARPHLEHFLETARAQHDASPSDARAEGGLADASGSMAELAAETGDLAAARAHARSMAAIAGRLAASDPENTYLRRMVMRAEELLARIDRDARRFDDEVRHLTVALGIAEQLADADPDDLRVHEDRARITWSLGVALAERGDLDEARRRLGEATTRFEQLHDRQPRHAATASGLAETRAALDGLARRSD